MGLSMPEIYLKMLGTFEAVLDGEPASGIETDKGRALLAYLALENGKLHRRESLAAMFWPESAPNRARQNLSQALYNLRQALHLQDSSILQVNMQEVVFQPDGLEVDALEFNRLMTICRQHHHVRIEVCPVCLPVLSRAVGLYRGDFLAGLTLAGCESFESWQLEHSQDFQEQVRRGLSWLAGGYELQGDLAQALSAARRWAALDSFDEAAVRQLMVLQTRLGNRAQALQTFERLQAQLNLELGIEPEAKTRAVYGNIRQGDLSGTGLPPNNLPASLTPFVGRQAELSALYLYLVDPTCRLLTLLGPGGIGKTRLALEAARSMLPAFPDGVYLLEMSDAGSAETLLSQIVGVVGLDSQNDMLASRTQEGGKFSQRLYHFLQEKEILLIVDSFEAIQNGGGLVIKDLLQYAPGVRILATSRVRLNIKGENLLVLEGLDISDESAAHEESSAVRLFVEAARRQHLEFNLAGENLSLTVQICRAVEGMPLGILLAAGWVGFIPLVDIIQRIKASLDFLASNWQDLPLRQCSLQATFEYSWDMLEPGLQQAFRRLAVFRRGFNVNRAASICGVSLLQVRALIERSLVQQGAPDRFRMHDVIHAFALEKLRLDPDEKTALYDRLSSEYLLALSDWGAKMKTNQLWAARDEMELEIENARLAWDLAALHGCSQVMLSASTALCRYYDMYNRRADGEQACRAVLDAIDTIGLSENNIHLWARLTTWLGIFSEPPFMEGIHEIEALHQFELVKAEFDNPAWAHLDTRWEQAFALGSYGRMLMEVDMESSQRLMEQSLQLFHQVGDPWDRADMIFSLATVQERLGDFFAERRLTKQGLEILGDNGDPLLLARLNYYLALSYLMVGESETALPLIYKSIGFFRQPESWDHTFNIMALVLWSGEWAQGLELILQLIAVRQGQGKKPSLILLGTLPIVLLQLGRYAEALHAFEDVRHNEYSSIVKFVPGTIHILKGEFPQAVESIKESAGYARRTPDHRVLGMVLALLSLAHACNGEPEQALAVLIEVIRTSLEDKNIFGVGHTLAVAALFMAQAGYPAKALQVYASASRHKTVLNSILLDEMVSKQIQRLAAGLSKDEQQAARAGGAEVEQAKMLQALLDCLENAACLKEGFKQLICS